MINRGFQYIFWLNSPEPVGNILKDRNYFSTEFSTDLASIGYRKEDSYITLDIRERMDANFSLPGDLFRLPLIGPDSATVSAGVSWGVSGCRASKPPKENPRVIHGRLR